MAPLRRPYEALTAVLFCFTEESRLSIKPQQISNQPFCGKRYFRLLCEIGCLDPSCKRTGFGDYTYIYITGPSTPLTVSLQGYADYPKYSWLFRPATNKLLTSMSLHGIKIAQYSPCMALYPLSRSPLKGSEDFPRSCCDSAGRHAQQHRTACGEAGARAGAGVAAKFMRQEYGPPIWAPGFL